jgi:hypothetical protein
MQKELARMLNVSYRTLRKALSSLEAERTIAPHKRGYAVPSLVEFPSRSATIVFILPGDKERNKAVFAGPDEQFLRILELECIHSGIHLDTVFFYETDNALKFFDTKSGLSYSISGSEAIIGYVVAETNLTEEVLARILRRLSHTKKRIAILTHKVPLSMPRQIVTPSLFGFFALGATERPGLHVGQYLLSKGHTRVAYITPYHLGVWSVNRYEGMKKAYAMAGYSDAVSLVDIGGRTEEIFTGQAHARYNFDKLRKFFESWRAQAPAQYRYGLDSGFEALATTHAAMAEMYYQLTPEFERLAQDKSITAWVASNDQVAMMALYYLRSTSIEVPEKISVIGFDNTNMALEANLTSYDFNTPGIARSCLHFLLRTNRFFGNRRSTVIDIDGHVIERKTVANLS